MQGLTQKEKWRERVFEKGTEEEREREREIGACVSGRGSAASEAGVERDVFVALTPLQSSTPLWPTNITTRWRYWRREIVRYWSRESACTTSTLMEMARVLLLDVSRRRMIRLRRRDRQVRLSLSLVSSAAPFVAGDNGRDRRKGRALGSKAQPLSTTTGSAPGGPPQTAQSP